MKTEEQLVNEGTAAEVLLQSEAFDSVVNDLVETTFQSFATSAPGENENREGAYQSYKALVDIVNTLKQRVAVRDDINERASESRSEEE
jgi:hypothetical protein|tara:strand:- start:773 stop:1039 length:267 start_codon:yes stop_codon:yes gene_type:complete